MGCRGTDASWRSWMNGEAGFWHLGGCPAGEARSFATQRAGWGLQASSALRRLVVLPAAWVRRPLAGAAVGKLVRESAAPE